MSVSFRVVGLSDELLGDFFTMDDTELRQHGARRVTASAKPGFPCRVSLADAEMGEELILLPFRHHEVDSPYQALGPVFVRKGARTAEPAVNELPEMLVRRPISVRAYDDGSMMVDATVVEGGPELRAAIEQMIADENVSYLHLHNAGPGCFNCRVERV